MVNRGLLDLIFTMLCVLDACRIVDKFFFSLYIIRYKTNLE